MNLNNIYLNFSSIPFTLGYFKEKRNHKPLSIFEAIIIAKKFGFGGVEFPFFRFFQNLKDAEKLKSFLRKNNMKYILDCEKALNVKEVKKILPVAKILNVKFIRVKSTNILNCNRKSLTNWKIIVRGIIKKINVILPLLRKSKVILALENHQDLDSADIINIIKSTDKKFVGLNFDLGNSFATLEDPCEFYFKTKKYIKNIHLKDYKIICNKGGLFLYQCSFGNGFIKNYTKKKSFFKKNKFPLSLEIGSFNIRNINTNKENFFKKFIKNNDQKKKYYFLLKKKYNSRFIYKNDLSKLSSEYELKSILNSVLYLTKLKV